MFQGGFARGRAHGSVPNWADQDGFMDVVVPSIGIVYIYLSDLWPHEVPLGPNHVDFQLPIPKLGFEKAGAFLTEVARKYKPVEEGKQN